jgi:hypothetical protein
LLALGTHLLAFEATVLGLPLHAELLALHALRPFSALHLAHLLALKAAAAMAAALLHDLELTATAAAAAATLELTAAATAVAAAVAMLLLGLLAATAAIAVPAAIAAGLRVSRACDRQSGYARGEEQPRHRKTPFEREKRPVSRTVPTVKRMEPAV